LGGRLSTVVLGGRTYEVGGSVIHPQNLIMLDLLKKMGEKKRLILK
jgi:protoporphyrinogen oxidase